MVDKISSFPPVLVVVRTLVMATAGGWLFNHLHVPLGWLLGALVVTIIGTRIFSAVEVPRLLRDIVSPVLGVLIGSSFSPALLGMVGQWPLGISIVLFYAALISIVGFAYFRFVVRLDPMTSFFAGVPGGLSEMTLLGISLGARANVLAVVHSLRIVAIVVAVPFIVRLMVHSSGSAGFLAGKPPLEILDAAILIACGVGGYLLSWVIRIPAGPLLIPLLFSAAVHMAGLTGGTPPSSIVSVAQIVIGAYIGVRFMDVAFLQVLSLVMHGLIWAAIMIGSAVGLAHLADYYFDGVESLPLLLALAPGGMSEMSLLTLSIGVEVAFVSTCHVMRILAVFLCVPMIAQILPKPRKKPAPGRQPDIDDFT